MARKATKESVISTDFKRLWGSKVVRIAAYSLVGLLIIGVFAYLGRSWVRITAVPTAVAVFHKNNVKDVATAQLRDLGSPLNGLGYNGSDVEHECRMSIAQGFKEVVVCTYAINAYTVLPADAAARSSIVKSAAETQEILKATDWVGTYDDDNDYASLKELVTNLTNGVDTTPDAAYEKTIGDVTCLFDTNTAFSQPSPPAMASRFICTESISIFGTTDMLQIPTTIMPEDSTGIIEYR